MRTKEDPQRGDAADGLVEAVKTFPGDVIVYKIGGCISLYPAVDRAAAALFRELAENHGDIIAMMVRYGRFLLNEKRAAAAGKRHLEVVPT